MPSYNWTSREDVVLLYYRSRDVPMDAVAALVSHKCRTTRSVGQCRDRLSYIKNIESNAGRPKLYSNVWNLNAVDRWLDGPRIPEGTANLLRFDSAARSIVRRVRKADPSNETV